MESEKDSQWKYACERVQFPQEVGAAVFVHDPLDSVAFWLLDGLCSGGRCDSPVQLLA